MDFDANLDVQRLAGYAALVAAAMCFPAAIQAHVQEQQHR